MSALTFQNLIQPLNLLRNPPVVTLEEREANVCFFVYP